jgi:predicted HAD superfamily Cof-like phosphohydrolase
MEEMNETIDAAVFDKKPEEVVDGLIDLCVFAIGTLDVFGVDANEAWDRVYAANMNKQVGVKPGRPNPFGLPDLLKPTGWTAPSHEGNHGNLKTAIE